MMADDGCRGSTAVPEISSSVEQIIGLFAELPLSDYDHALTFPLFLCGCMTDSPNIQETIKSRLQFTDDRSGKVAHVRAIMENTWFKRAAAQGQHSPLTSLDWRDNLHEWGNLLLL